MRLWVHTLGCKVNLADTASILRAIGQEVEVVDDLSTSDVALLNTCTVTHKADRDARKILGRLCRERPDLPIVVTGCLAARAPSEFARFPNVQVIQATDPEAIGAALRSAVFQGPSTGDTAPFWRLGRQRAFAKVQDGCNSSCAYCIVPRVRGRERSLPLLKARELVLRLASEGHQEIVLTGIHLGRYGRDLTPRTSLAELIAGLASLERGLRIRLSSIEPLEWTDELIEVCRRSTFVCRHFHLPLQSSDDRVLEAMRRPCRADEQVAAVRRLRALFPEAALGADVMAGFPGEDERAFEASAAAIEALPLDYLHVFTYSPRPDTLAAKLPGQVPAEVSRRRAASLRRIGLRAWSRFTEAGIGVDHAMLVEESTPRGFVGRSEHYRRLLLAGSDEALLGSIVRVRAQAREGERLVVGLLEGGRCQA